MKTKQNRDKGGGASSVGALIEGPIIQQLQQIGAQEKLKNRVAIKTLIRCTHILARRHIPHTTNFDELVDLIVSCGAEDLKRFLERAGKNATYISKIAVVSYYSWLMGRRMPTETSSSSIQFQHNG